VKGLTTAAGLWASAAIGLALGIGFYYGALIATVLIFIVMNAFGYINSYLYKHSGVVQFFIEMDAVSGVSKLLAHLNEKEVDIKDFEVFKTQSNAPTFAVHMTVKCPKACPPGDLMTWIMELDGVVFVEEI
jgi:putative Mg2+ transporter-C (MgtC) family protein